MSDEIIYINDLVNSETKLFRIYIEDMLITGNISKLFAVRRWLIKRINRILVFKLKHWKVVFKRENEKE